jgi:V-type H+-transporting ATPase proteolipid subunit
MAEGVLDLCPVWGPMLGFMGATSAIIFSNIGAAYGTGKCGQAISQTGVKRPDLTFKNIIPIVMAGVLGIFGLIIAVVIGTGIEPFSTGSGTYMDYSLYTGCAHLAAGLTVGLASLSCGICIGISGEAGVLSVAAAPKNKPSHVTKVYVGMVLIQGCASALAMYGLIIALLLSINVSNDCNPILR